LYTYAAISDFSLGDAGDSFTLAGTWRTYSKWPEASAKKPQVLQGVWKAGEVIRRTPSNQKGHKGAFGKEINET
jgi:hypothetical protein